MVTSTGSGRDEEDRYGNTTEIFNVVLQGIQQFQLSKNQNVRHQGIVKLVDELDRGGQDLEAIDAKKEITNACANTGG